MFPAMLHSGVSSRFLFLLSFLSNEQVSMRFNENIWNKNKYIAIGIYELLETYFISYNKFKKMLFTKIL